MEISWRSTVCLLIFSHLAQNDPDSWVVIETTTKPGQGWY